MTQRPPLSRFRIASVAEQAEQALRAFIRDGTLAEQLPSESQLAHDLGIGLSSLRTALANLEKAGVITRRNGLRARITPRGAQQRERKAPPTVCIVSSLSRETVAPDLNPVVLALNANFSSRGIRWEEVFDAKLDRGPPENRLRTLVADRDHVCWLLHGCSTPVLRWFSRSKLPAFLIGSCPPGVVLPSVDYDNRAVGWHSAGHLTKHGHRHIALLRPRRALTGDFDSCAGFLSYIERNAPGTAVVTITVDRDLSSLGAKLDQAMASAHPPSAFFALHPGAALKTIFHLLKAGHRIPRDVSVMCRDSISLFDTVLPEITRYHGSNLLLFRRASRIAQALLAGHAVPPKASLVTPSFIPGLTAGRAPK